MQEQLFPTSAENEPKPETKLSAVLGQAALDLELDPEDAAPEPYVVYCGDCGQPLPCSHARKGRTYG